MFSIDNIKNTILTGNCIDIMKKIPDNSISVCITDPPYNYEFIGKDWNADEIKRRTERVKSSSTLVKNIPYGSGLSGGVRNERWYKRNRENTLAYISWTEEWGKELYRILKPGGIVFTFNSTRSVANIQTALENVGFYARDIIVWRRNSGIPKGINIEKKLKSMGYDEAEKWKGWHSCLRNEWEAISFVQKPLNNNYFETLFKYNIGLLNAKDDFGFKSNIIENITRDKIDKEINSHVTIKPLQLIEYLINLSTPDSQESIIIDPFLGSGTTALAAKKLNRNYIGIEINPEYVDIAHYRLENE